MSLGIITQIRPQHLRNHTRAPNGLHKLPLESCHGKAFFSASENVYPLLLSEWGSLGVKSSGAIGLFCPQTKRAFELLQEGDDIEGHHGRFLPGGLYHDWIQDRQILEYILLDFRTAVPRKPHPSRFRVHSLCISWFTALSGFDKLN